MKYTYPVIVYKVDNEYSFFFKDLPSGIESMEENELDYAPEDVLYSLLTDEEFLPHSMLAKPTKVEEIDPVEEVKKLLHIGIDKENCFARDVTVDTDEI